VKASIFCANVGFKKQDLYKTTDYTIVDRNTDLFKLEQKKPNLLRQPPHPAVNVNPKYAFR
jgi:hypothetical protein